MIIVYELQTDYVHSSHNCGSSVMWAVFDCCAAVLLEVLELTDITGLAGYYLTSIITLESWIADDTCSADCFTQWIPYSTVLIIEGTILRTRICVTPDLEPCNFRPGHISGFKRPQSYARDWQTRIQSLKTDISNRDICGTTLLTSSPYPQRDPAPCHFLTRLLFGYILWEC